MTKIQWTEKTWNPVRGCSRVSDGCTNCYAMRQAHRFSGASKLYEGLTTIRKGKVDWSGVVRFVPEMLDVPLRTIKPTTWFVNSMSDLFHESLPDAVIDRVFAVMALTRRHTYQVLTRRAGRMLRYAQALTSERLIDACNHSVDGGEHRPGAYNLASISAMQRRRLVEIGSWDASRALSRPPLPNVWLGVSAEDQQRADERIPHLLATPAAVRFVSAEPLLEPIDFDQWLAPVNGNCKAHHGYNCGICRPRGDGAGLHWVIVGGESGPGARPCNVEWLRNIVAQCRAAGVACFVKQLGSEPAFRRFHSYHHIRGELFVKRLRDRHGGDPSEWPEDLRIREMPEVRA